MNPNPDLDARGPVPEGPTAIPPRLMNRRALLRTVGLAGLGLGAGAALGGAPALLGALGASPAGAATTCAPASRIGDIRIISGNLFGFLGLNGPDIARTTDGGATFGLQGTFDPGGSFVPYAAGTNGVPGSFGIAGDHGRVIIFDAVSGVWRGAQPGGSAPILTGLAGNGAFWIVVSTEGKFWYTRDNGATWSAPSNGAYLNYKSIASILTVYDLEYANGVWIGCGYDTLGVGRTFWRSTVANPTRGAKNSWFSVSGGDFAEVIGSGDANAVSVYGVAYGGNCQPNPNTWYGAGNFGTVWRSTDNGASWSKWRDSGSHIHYGVDVNPYTGKVLTASGLGGIIEVNPGMVQRYDPGSKEVYDIAYCGGSDWVACGDNGQMLVSHDDGVTWTAAVTPAGTGGTLYNLIVKLWS